MTEIWKDVAGYEGLYQVSNLGRVKSLDRVDSNGHHLTGKLLSDNRLCKGYRIVGLNKENKQTSIRVNRLVALTFIPNLDGKKEVNHKDGNKLNNRVDNLEWVTGIENKQHAKKLGLELNKGGKSISQYSMSGEFIKTYKSSREIERELGFYHSAIIACCRNKFKSAYGFMWRYL